VRAARPEAIAAALEAVEARNYAAALVVRLQAEGAATEAAEAALALTEAVVLHALPWAVSVVEQEARLGPWALMGHTGPDWRTSSTTAATGPEVFSTPWARTAT
jgi:hypothetical protein